MALSANLYYEVGQRGESKLDEVRDGLEIIGDVIGGISVEKVLGIKFPNKTNGQVDVSRVGYGNFDVATALHVIVAPVYDGRQSVKDGFKSLGRAYYGTGVAFVNSIQSSITIATTTAHEAAHSLGFVSEERTKRDETYHCLENNCLMNSEDRSIAGSVGEIDYVFSKLFSEEWGEFVKFLPKNDFCGHCKDDMRTNIKRNLGIMALSRSNRNSV